MLRQQHHLSEIERRYPGLWRLHDSFFNDRGKTLPDWPRWCYAPLAAPTIDVALVGALAAWRATQTIYRFDSTMAQALMSTDLTSGLPCEALYRLPEWCVYIETPPGLTFAGKRIVGLYAHLEWDANDHRTELRLVMDREDGELYPFPMHFAQTIHDAIAAACAESHRQGVGMGYSMTLPSLDTVDANHGLPDYTIVTSQLN